MRALLIVALLAGCSRDSLSANGDGGTCEGEVRLSIPSPPRRQVDVLFVIDNSNAVSSFTQQLRDQFGDFLREFNELAMAGVFVDLQLGVVTTDYGAGATGAPGCQPSPGGQQGRLQGRGAAAPMTCPNGPLGANYIHYDFADPGSSNLQGGLDLAGQFQCMSAVGAFGCGFEHVLESAYAALHNQIPENAGFLRDEALLAVLFVTDEDDCSAPPDSMLFDKNRSAQFGYEGSFRCTRFGLVCGDGVAPPYDDSKGPLRDCRPAPNPGGGGPGLLYDVRRYTDFFSLPAAQGGVKANPGDVILAAIDAPDTPVQVILSSPGTPAPPYEECPRLNEATNPPCVPVLQPSCVLPFPGYPAVRINAVVRSVRTNAVGSLCDGDGDLAAPLGRFTSLIAGRLAGGCLPAALPDPRDPDCAVEDITQDSDGTVTSHAMPSCDANVFPCWRVVEQPACRALSPQSLGLTIDRGGKAAPPNTRSRAACAVRCQ